MSEYFGVHKLNDSGIQKLEEACFFAKKAMAKQDKNQE
jgi:hypothetical protein